MDEGQRDPDLSTLGSGHTGTRSDATIRVPLVVYRGTGVMATATGIGAVALLAGALGIEAVAAPQPAPTFEIISIRAVPNDRHTTYVPLGREVQPKGRFVRPGIAI
jgi:hypothetical protein